MDPLNSKNRVSLGSSKDTDKRVISMDFIKICDRGHPLVSSLLFVNFQLELDQLIATIGSLVRDEM